MKIFIFLVCALLTVPALAAQQSGRDVLNKQKELHKTKTEVETQKMVLIDKASNKESREIKRYLKETDKDIYKALVIFQDPKDIKGTALLTWQKKGGADDQWLYLPAQGKMQRIAQGGKQNYFMGTDFTYEDLESESIDDSEYTILREEEIEKEPAYVIEAVAKAEKKKDTAYGKRILWITKDKYLTKKVEFYDRQGKLVKVQTNHDWEKVDGTVWRPKQMLMDNLKENHKTAVGVVAREINNKLENQIFTERFVLSGSH